MTSYIIGHHNITIGNYSSIGPNATVYAYNSELVIGEKSGIGPGCHIITGNHSTRIVGKFYKDYKLSDKLEEDDMPVILEDDVWVGANVTILTGVTIGRGAVIGAGSVVVRSIPPYSIAVGNPAKVKKMRFTLEEIYAHERLLYPVEKRLKEVHHYEL